MSIYLKLGSPLILTVPIGYWAYNKRQTALRHPVLSRAMMHLKKDQRILDFCGDTIKPGYWITVNENPTDNYIKFDLNLKGSSGDLGASVIADYLTHRELNILEEERKDYFESRNKLKDEI